LNFDMSDLIQEAAYRWNAIYAADGEIIGINGRKLRTASRGGRYWINQHLYLTRLALFYFDRKFAKTDVTIENVVTLANPEILKHTLAEDDADRKEQWKNIFNSFLKVKKYCDSNGINFLLTVYPWGHQVSNKEWVPGRFRFIPKNAVV